MTKQEANQLNTTTLAYLGDAVYEVKIREYVIAKCAHDVNQAHKLGVKYVNADGQAKAARTLINDALLSEDEERLLKRARNHRTLSRPNNADPKNYKLATGLEALIGYLHLTGEDDRLDEIVQHAIRIIDVQL